MKKILLLLTVCVFTITVYSQTLVNTDAQDRSAILEEYTGIHCGYCPDGHSIARSIYETNPGRVSLINVHAGTFAVPNAGEPDFRTVDGEMLATTFGVSGYPSGTINRHTFPGGMVLSRGAWEGAVDDILQLSSPVNLGLSSDFNSSTRDLTVTVELYYTDNSVVSSNFINVVLKESHIIGWQTDYGNGNDPNYDHTNVFRAFLTGTWGDEVTTTTMGTFVTRTYLYNVPVDFDIDNCDVVAFIAEDQEEIYMGTQVVADGGTTLVVGDLETSSVNYVGGQPANIESFNTTATNVLSTTEDFIFTLSSDDAPVDWSASFMIGGNTYTGSATIAINSGMTENITVDVLPGNTPDIATFELSMSSASNPNAPMLVNTYNVISGVTDLVVSNPTAVDWAPLYMSGLDAAGNNAKTSTDRSTLINFNSFGALTDVNNIYYNVSWTFPALTDNLVNELSDFLDNGGNMLIAGQDIGWDNSGAANSNGTPTTIAFYEDYMHADYQDDGSVSNSQVDWVSTDGVFGQVPSVGINDIHNGNNYPEEIDPISPAQEIFFYNGNANKIGGIRVETANYKIVYFGIGVEQVDDAAIADQMVKLSHDWFYGIVSVEEFDARLAAVLGQSYPNPTNDVAYIPLTGLEEDATLNLYDPMGKLILELQIPRGMNIIDLDLSALGSGLYSYQLIGSDGATYARTLQVIR